MSHLGKFLNSSIGRKQIVASTGLLLILFVTGHLAGNLLIYLGPEAYNHYAEKLAGLRPGLYLVEVALSVVFLIHVLVTAILVFDNAKAREHQYHVYKPKGERSLATRLMPLTGTFLFAFILWHLVDFTFADKSGSLSLLADGKSYGIYGVVFNSFSHPVHSGLYVAAMLCLGLHLSHGIGSFAQTFGFSNEKNCLLIERISTFIGYMIAFAYSSIPIYVLSVSRF